MKSNPTKYKVTKTGHSGIVQGYKYHHKRSKLQESTYDWDLGVNEAISLSPNNNISLIVKELNYTSVNVNITFK